MTKTIHTLPVVTTAAVADEIPMWRVANNDTKRITKANFVGATITGGGTIATGGFTLTVGGNSAINGTMTGNLSALGYTLTVPATGTAGLLEVVQTYTGAKTFSSLVTASAGINMGGTTFNQYVQNTWVPVDASPAGLTLSVAAGRYTRIGRMLFANFNITYPTTSDSTNNALIGGLPFSALAIGGTTGGGGFVFASSTTFPFFITVTTSSTMNFINANTAASMKNADLSAKTIRGWVIYDI